MRDRQLCELHQLQQGINGIIVDIADIAGTPTATDFEFCTINDDDTANWPLAPAPSSVAVRQGAGSDRVTIVSPMT